jgi:hypothetical protein
MEYVTYDPATGNLTGSYMQDLLPEHEAFHIEVSYEVRLNWCAYRANAARDGVELAPVVVDLPALKATAIAKTYPDVDAVYKAAVGRRTTEYEKAEDAARAYKAAGYTGEISTRVSKYAEKNSTGVAQTNRWATDQIIARADAFHAAEDSMRDARFDSQADMRAATTQVELDAAVAEWDSFIAATRADLGL